MLTLYSFVLELPFLTGGRNDPIHKRKGLLFCGHSRIGMAQCQTVVENGMTEYGIIPDKANWEKRFLLPVNHRSISFFHELECFCFLYS